MTTTATMTTPGALAARAPEDTKERLMAAGIEVFAERGFAAAGIREICGRAGANPAAINYHFGDKERFYAEVLVTCHQRAAARRRMPRLADDPERPEAALRAWILWFLTFLLEEEGSSSPIGKLVAREMFQPTPAIDELIRRSIRPIMEALGEIVRALLGADDRRDVYLSVHSVLGQCLLYKHAQPVFERLHQEAQEPASQPHELARDVDALARHIAEFSLAGLAEVRRRNGDDS